MYFIYICLLLFFDYLVAKTIHIYIYIGNKTHKNNILC